MNGKSPRRRAAGPLRIGSRWGGVLIAVLVCLLVVSMISAAMVRSMIQSHRQMRVHQQRAQAFWLAESAAGLARARLGSNPDYPGETWSVPADQLGTSAAGAVTIRVEAIGDQPSMRRIVIDATYPIDPLRRTRYQKQLVMKLPHPGDGP